MSTAVGPYHHGNRALLAAFGDISAATTFLTLQIKNVKRFVRVQELGHIQNLQLIRICIVD